MPQTRVGPPPEKSGSGPARSLLLGSGDGQTNKRTRPTPQAPIAAYSGRTLLGTISATARGWLAISVTGRKLGVFSTRTEAVRALADHIAEVSPCASQVAAAAQLAIAYPKIGGHHDAAFVLGVSTQFLDIGRMKSHNYGPEFFYFGSQVGYRRDDILSWLESRAAKWEARLKEMPRPLMIIDHPVEHRPHIPSRRIDVEEVRAPKRGAAK